MRGNVRIAREVGAFAVTGDPALLKHIRIVGDSQRSARVLLHEKNGQTGRAEVLERVKDLMHEQRRETRIGSSSIRKRGSPINARPIASICCCPPERDPPS